MQFIRNAVVVVFVVPLPDPQLVYGSELLQVHQVRRELVLRMKERDAEAPSFAPVAVGRFAAELDCRDDPCPVLVFLDCDQR